MRAQRRLAVLAAAGTIFMAAASVLLAPGVASANPGNDENKRGRPGYHAPHGNGNGQGSGYGNGHGHGNNNGGGSGSGNGNNYPAPPASVGVSSGTVAAGKAVKVTGNGFAPNELVVIQVRYRPGTMFWFPKQGFVIGQQTVRANKDGKFKTYAQTWLPGKVTIHARGTKSGKTGSATVKVLPRGWGGGGWGGGWWGAGESGTPAGTVAVSNNTPAPGRGDSTPMYVLAATVLALVGSTLLTQRISRRRRSSTA
jgi:hypothetical protein